MNEPKVASSFSIERLHQLAVSETGFVFDPQTGQSFSVNATGLVVLQLLKKGDDKEAVASELASRCGIQKELALSSIQAFLLQLGRYI